MGRNALLVSGVGPETASGHVKPRGEHLLPWIYKRKGVDLYPFYPGWLSQPLEDIEACLQHQARRRSDQLGRRPVGIGVSGGGLLLLRNHQLFEKIVVINSHIRNTDDEADARADQYPAYKEALDYMPFTQAEIAHTGRGHDILTFSSDFDRVLGSANTYLAGAYNRDVAHFGPFPNWGHTVGSALTLVFGADQIVEFVTGRFPPH